MKNKSYIGIAAAVIMVLCGSAQAESVTADQAKTAVRQWLRDDSALGCPLQGDVCDVRTCTPTNGASFHVVKMSGGGFVVTSADTRRAPIVAFSSGAELVEDDANPLWVLLKNDLAIRTQGESSVVKMRRVGALSSEESNNEAKWAKLLGSGMRTLSSQGVASVSDVRVAPLVQSKWSQEDAAGEPCYNYYTPNNYPCGCVATVGAQIMRYFRYPTSSMQPYTNPNCAVDGATAVLTTQGGIYNWSQMPLVPDSSITENQRRSIGKLTSDVGICVCMKYTQNAGASGGFMLAHAFTNYFGYASAMVAQWGQNEDHSESQDVKNAMLSNFDAGLPVALSLRCANGGHEIVGDGYGYSDGMLYVHFNMGWGGLDDAWYAPPAMGTTDFNFDVLNGVVYNIFTNHTSRTVICSGRVLDANGIPVENATVSYRRQGTSGGGTSTHGPNNTGYVYTNQKGIYALFLTPGNYTLTASFGSSSSSFAITLSQNVSIEYSFPSGYWDNPKPIVNNVCDKTFVLTNVASVDEPQFNPPSCLFYPFTNIVISCTTEDAIVRYTLDGTDPTESSPVYNGPIFIEDDTTIKARAWRSGMNPSVVVTSTYTYDAAQGAPKGDYFANPIKISGADGRYFISDNSAYTEEPGEPQHTDLWYDEEDGRWYRNYELRTVWYEWTAPGSGTMKFLTESYDNMFIYPTYIAVYTGDDISSIQRKAVSTEIDPDDYTTSLFFEVEQGVTYHVVGMVGCPIVDEMGNDTSASFSFYWHGDLVVTPTETSTSTTDVPVPYVWIDEYYPNQGGSTIAYEALANYDSDGDGFTTWQEFLLGTDPTNTESRLTATVRMEGGVPVFEWTPKNPDIDKIGYRYEKMGRRSLDDAAGWQPFTEGHRFFKVVVEPITSTHTGNQ